MKLPKAYLASPLDTKEQLRANLFIKQKLEDKGFEVYLPQADTGLDLDEQYTCAMDLGAIRSCDIFLFNLDATDIGCAIELGYAMAQGIPCWGVTEHNNTIQKYHNDMLHCITKIITI